jgi:hypothetical protein
MSRLGISKARTQQLLDNHHAFLFPEFVLGLRKAIGISRTIAACDLNISYLKFLHIENGNFRKPIDHKIIDDIAEYFEIPLEIMREKASFYIRRGSK